MLRELLIEFGLGVIATVGFGILFNVPRRTLAAACLTGGLGRVCRLICANGGFSVEAASFVASLLVGLLGQILAMRYGTPRTVFTVTGIIPMVPGVPAFSAVLDFATGDISGGLIFMVQTGLIAGALAMGLTTVRILVRLLGLRRIEYRNEGKTEGQQPTG